MRFWRALRDRPDELVAAIAATPYSRVEWNLCREQPHAADDVEATRRFPRLDRPVVQPRGHGLVAALDSPPPPRPLATRLWANLPDKLAAAAHRLAGVALELIPCYDLPEAVIYCDPPYAGPWRLEPCKGYRHDQAEHLWPRLVEVLTRVKHAAVTLSGYPCQAATDLGWTRLDLAMSAA